MTTSNLRPVEWWRHEWPFVVCALAAVLVRLDGLGRDPLSAAEAAAAWLAWNSAADGAAAVPPLAARPASAALFGLQSAWFWLAGGSDVTARLPVALAGAAVVLLPWRFSEVLGRRESMVLAALLAVDPVSVAWSRLADGAALAQASAWAVLFCGAAAVAPAVSARLRSQAAFALGPALGLLAASGPLAWDLLMPLLLLHLVVTRGLVAWRRSLAAAGLAAVAVASCGFTAWAGPPLVSASVTEWLQAWSGGAGSRAAVWPSLVGLQLLPMACGAAGLAAMAAGHLRTPADASGLRSRAAGGALCAWLAWAVVGPGTGPQAWIVAQVPLFIGAALALPRAIATVRGLRAGPLARAAVTTACGLLAVHYAGGALKVASGGDAVDAGPRHEVPEPAIRQLSGDLAMVLGHRARLDVVAPAGPDPVLAWYLRGHESVRWVLAAPLRASSDRHRLLTIEPVATGAHVASYPLWRRAGVVNHVHVTRPRGDR